MASVDYDDKNLASVCDKNELRNFVRQCLSSDWLPIALFLLVFLNPPLGILICR